MSDAVKRALAQVPGWESASVARLKGGLTNSCWLIERGERKAVLKIDDSPRGAPFSSRLAEAEFQARAAKHGLANSVIFANDTMLVTEYIDGAVWSAGSLDVNENLEKLATAMKKLHALALTGRSFDAIGAARVYADRISAADRVKHAPKIHECLEKIAAMPLPDNLCCCHNDLVAANIVNVPELRFLDWEYACDNDPFFDIATIVAHHRLPSERAHYFLDAYFDGDGARWRGQLARQTEFYDALHWLWEAARSPTVA